ncbi:hypothetical protein F5J12DRAFT_955853, partial [Pisolithus orientalis]|uniref:uncharacterized protein n=1 Tax=Pisolithus orientalis TaxID=936130 RepID=UPI00222427B2
QAEEDPHPCTRWHVSASRYNLKDSTNHIIVVDTTSLHTNYDFYTERIMTSWLKSRFTKKCPSGILFLHSLAKDPKDHDILMQRHLDMFAMRFPNKSIVPSHIYVVPTGNPADAKLGQRLSELESVMKSSNVNGSRKWHVSMFPGVFDGGPVIAWSAAVLLKNMVENQTNEMFSSRRPTSKEIPPKLPDNCAGLKNLAEHLFGRYKEESMNNSLDAKIVLGRVVRDLTPASDPGHVSALIAYADLLSERFAKQERKADLHEFVTLRRTAWQSTPPHDSRWKGTLATLDDGLYARFGRGGVADLEEIISLRRTVSQLTSLPDLCRSPVHLTNALHKRYRILCLRSDLEEAIKLARDALAQYPSNDPDHALAQECLVDCPQTKVGKGAAYAARAVTDASECNPSDIQKVITNIISETVAKMPPRLLHTPTGALCDQDVLISHFVNSPAYLGLY